MERTTIHQQLVPGKRALWIVILIAGVVISVGLVATNAQAALALLGALLAIAISWIVLIGLGWWHKYSDWYVVLFLLSILSGNVYLVPLGSVNLWISLSDVFLFSSLVILVHEHQKGRLRGWAKLIGLMLLTFWLLVLSRGMVAEQPTRALAAAKTVASGLLTFLVTSRAHLDDRAIGKRLLPAVWLWAIGLLVVAMLAVVTVMQESGLSLRAVALRKIDYVTPLGRSNYIASLALLLWPISLYGTLATPWSPRKVFGILGTCGLVSLPFLVYSRGALITLAATLPLVLVFGGLALRRRQLCITIRQLLMMPVWLLIVGILVGWSWKWLQPLIQQASVLLASPETWSSYSTAQARFRLWEQAWNSFVDSPIWGYGLYNVTSINPVSGAMLLTHNLPLQLLAETGILGAVLYFMALGLVTLRLVKIVRKVRWRENRYVLALSAGVLVAMFVTLLNSLVEANFLTRDFDLLFWGLAGCALAGARNAASDGVQ
jgi:O-antigen ligase